MRKFVACKFASLFVLFILHPSSFSLSSDWPQFQCNAARTGWTPDSPAPPYEFAYFLDFGWEPIGLVQPVIYRDVMYFPTLHGRLYAFKPETGERLWAREGMGPITRAAACADGLVYTADLDGVVNATDAQTGAPAWRRDLGFPISASPCLDAGRIYLGTRNGVFYCLEGKTGAIVWERAFEPGEWVWSSAAAADGSVYIGVDGALHLYCLDAETGGVKWKSQKLRGAFMRDWCPVVAAGRVFVNTIPAELVQVPVVKPYEEWGVEKEVFEKYHAELRAGRLPQAFLDANEKIMEIFEQQPIKRTMFAFDAQTGEEFVVQGYRLLTGWLSAAPPPAVDSEGMLQVPVPYDCGRFGRMDPRTGRITSIFVAPYKGPDNPNPPLPNRNDGFGTSPDECHAPSCGGDRVFWVHFTVGNCDSALGYNIKTHELTGMAGFFNNDQRAYYNASRIMATVSDYKSPDHGLGNHTSGSWYTAAAIWKDMLFHFKGYGGVGGGGYLTAVRGKGGE